jgi:hypothetical protein
MQTSSKKIALVSRGLFTVGGSPTYGQATTAGNLAVCWVASNGTLSIIGAGWIAATPINNNCMIYYKENIGANESPPTINTFGSETYTQLAEFSVVTTNGALDQSKTTGGTSPLAITNSASELSPSELIIYNGFWNGTNTGGIVSGAAITDGAGNSITPSVSSGVQQANQYYCFMFGIASTGLPTVADSATASLNVFSGGTCCIASFKP